MKLFFKIMITIVLFVFSLYYINNATNFIKNNDKLMQQIKSKEIIFNIKPTNAIITKTTMIPGIRGQFINLDKSYNKMKKIHKYNESLLVFDYVYPNISIKNHYDKVILHGNKKMKVSIVISANDNLLNEIDKVLKQHHLYIDLLRNESLSSELNFKNLLSLNNNDNTNYCLTYDLTISKDCINNHKYTILGYEINNYFLTQTKNLLKDGIILVYYFNENNYYNLNTIIKYLKNNNYEIVTIDELIKE